MNHKIVFKSLFAVYYSMFFVATQQYLTSNSTVLAQDVTRNKINSSQLSTQEKTILKQGKVILKGQKGNYQGQVLAQGNLNTAWKVLTDYNNFKHFVPNIASSKVISAKGDRIVFEQVNVVDLWLFTKQFTVQIEAINHPTQKTVDFKIVKGDLKKLVGKWQLQAVSPNQVLLQHDVSVEPVSTTEKPMFYGVYESCLEKTLGAMAQEITKRSKAQS